MLYVSTRGGGKPQRFSDILLEGLAADGGLYVPERFPAADLGRWRRLSYPQLAQAILREFMDDVPALDELVARTYTGRIFGSDDITPLRTLEPGLHLLALSNGPSAAFKDVALQLLGARLSGSVGHGETFLCGWNAATRVRTRQHEGCSVGRHHQHLPPQRAFKDWHHGQLGVRRRQRAGLK